jgi:hypothetical protein
MIGYILAESEKTNIQGQEYAPYQLFNCVQDNNGIWYTFLTDVDKLIILDTEFKWLLNCPQGEYILEPFVFG